MHLSYQNKKNTNGHSHNLKINKASIHENLNHKATINSGDGAMSIKRSRQTAFVTKDVT